MQASLRHATGGLMQLLDSHQEAARGRASGSERLLARAAATAIGPADLGLDEATAEFRPARCAIDRRRGLSGSRPAGLAVGHDPVVGGERLAMLRALGVVEPIAAPTSGVCTRSTRRRCARWRDDVLVAALTTARFDVLLTEAALGAPLLLRTRRPDTLAALVTRAETGPLMLEPSEAPVGPGRPADLLLAAGRAAGGDATI